jgi:hypothetical protein
MCFKAKGNRRIEINHNLRRLKAKARELLLSEEGIKHRKKRCIEPEPVFSHIRYDGAYLRFRHFGQDKIEMDFTVLAIALNLSKLARKMALSDKIPEKKHQKGLFIECFQVYIIKIKATAENLGEYTNIAA